MDNKTVTTPGEISLDQMLAWLRRAADFHDQDEARVLTPNDGDGAMLNAIHQFIENEKKLAQRLALIASDNLMMLRHPPRFK